MELVAPSVSRVRFVPTVAVSSPVLRARPTAPETVSTYKLIQIIVVLVRRSVLLVKYARQDCAKSRVNLASTTVRVVASTFRPTV